MEAATSFTNHKFSNVPEERKKKLSNFTFALLSACKETPELAASDITATFWS